MEETNQKKKMSLFVATALVVGNMIGSGVFMLPNTLANEAGPGATLIAWVITSIGSIILALSFARASSFIPKIGGPYEYSREAFGDFTGFLNAWLYWTGSWIGNTAIIIAIGSYAGAIFPIIGSNKVVGFLFCSLIIWGSTYLNIRGVEAVGKVGTVMTVIKLSVLILFIVVAGCHFSGENIGQLFPSGKGLETVPKAATVTLWAFVGLESASVVAGNIENPEKNVYKSTVIGILIASIFYFILSLVAMGAMPQAELAVSNAPIADILSKFLGSGIVQVLNLAIVVGLLGSSIGWVLSAASIAYAAGEDRVFPKVFAKKSKKYGTPIAALIISSALTNVVLFMNFADGFAKAVSIITLLATLSYLPIYAYTAIADIIILNKVGKLTGSILLKKSIVPVLGFAYAIWAIYGSGAETVMWGFLLMLIGVPIYAYLNIKYKSKVE